MNGTRRSTHGGHRLVLMATALVVVGVPSGLGAGVAFGPLAGVALGIAAGWSAACLLFFTVLHLDIRGFDAAQTREHATVEDPGRGTADVLCLAASIVCVLAVVALMVTTRNVHGTVALVIGVTALVNVAISWTLVHIVYMLSYARIYYSDPGGGISFNTDAPPRYLDFAYLAFVLGMTYQVSDTSVSTSELRGAILKHTLLSYLLGVVVLASVINLVAGLR